jgi:hypothetical protein
MQKTRGIAIVIGMAVAITLCTTNLMAQIEVSTILGTATDQSGAVVPGVGVSLVDLGTNAKWNAKADVHGNFQISGLLHGTYRLSATAPGFKTFIANNIILTAQETRRVDVSLTLGSTTTQVMVNASAAVISTDSAKISGNYLGSAARKAPLIGDARNEIQFLTTRPDVQFTSDIYDVEMAGQSGNQLQESMDGMATGDGAGNQMAGLDVTQQVTVVAVNNPAQYARIANYNVVTKSGSNDWHGSIYWWLQNSALNASDYFAPVKPESKVDTFHADLGGPIIKNNTFFYFSYGGERFPGGHSILTTVPTASMRTGDFSQLLTLSSSIVIKDPLTGLPFPGNVIPSDRLSPTSLAVLSNYVPAPNVGEGGLLSNNYSFIWTHPSDTYAYNAYDVRIDHQFSQDNHFFGRYMWNTLLYDLAGNYPALGFTRVRLSKFPMIQDTHIFSNNLVNNARVGLYWNVTKDGTTEGGYTPLRGASVVKTIGLQGVNPKSYVASGFPEMDIAGYPSLALPDGGGGTLSDYKNWDYADTLTWVKGRHVLTLGIDFRKFSQLSTFVPSTIYGTYDFDGFFSGYGPADFLLGLPHTSEVNPLPQIDLTLLSSEMGPFIQDTFKATKRLTLEMGVRWDKFGSPTYSNGLIYNWDLKTGDVVVPPKAIGSVSPLYPSTIKVVAGTTRQRPQLDNIAPRIGVAYRLRKNAVVRGGYGIFTEALGDFAGAQTGGPYSLTETFFNSVVNAKPLFSFPNPFPSSEVAGTVPSQSVTGYPRDTSNGRIHQFNVTVEQQVKNVGFRLSYIGSRGRGLNYSIPINLPEPSLIPFSPSRLPYPQFIAAKYDRSKGETNYNALAFAVQRKVGQLVFNAGWTWASNLTNMEDLENPYAPLRWSNDPYTSRQRVVINADWQIPVGRGREFLANAGTVEDRILGGWQLYYIGYFATGQWFSPSYSGADPSNTNTFGGLPDQACNGNHLPSGQRSITHWFNPSCYVVPKQGTFGNASPYSLEGPGMNDQNLMIGKTFRIAEGLHFDLSAAFQNVFNHPNFSNPTANISAPTAGVISSDQSYVGPRTTIIRATLEF